MKETPSPAGGELSVEGIRRYLRHGELSIEYQPVVTSTNTLLKERLLDVIT